MITNTAEEWYLLFAVLRKCILVPWRWHGKTGGAIGFALIFLLLFLSRKKVKKEFKELDFREQLNE